MKKFTIFLMMLCLACFGVANAQTSLWSENFEGGSMPSGWTTDGSGSWSVATAVNSTHPSSAGEGTYCAQISHGSTGNATKLITPEIDLSSVTSAELSFMHVHQDWYGDNDALKVYYRTSSSGAWTKLMEYTDAYESWTTESGIVLPNLSRTYQIAFEYIDAYGYGLGIDDINIVRGASCPAPQTVAASNPTAHGATISWAGSSDSYIVMVAEPAVNASYDFETGSMPSAFTNSSTNAWSVVANNHSGSYCAKSASGFTSTNSDLELTVNLAAAGSVDFSALVSSESGWDYGRFLIDGTQKFQVSGTSNSWEDYSFPLTAGSHTLTWRYYKDSSGNQGDDCFYVDDIVINENPSSWDETHTASASPYTFTDLDPETSYLVMVKGICDGEPSEPSAAVSFTTLESCATPQNLAVTTDGATATATWTGVEGTCNIDINGTVTNNVSSPYEFRVELSTTYTVKVQANCDGGETSDWSSPVSITTPDCVGGHTINYTLNDSYGDGWNGASITVIEGCDVLTTLTVSASSSSGTLTLCGDYVEFVWNSGSYDSECSFTFSEGGTTLFTKPSSLSDGQVLYTIGTQAMPKPTGLTAGTPEAHSVDLSWTENGNATAWQICVNGDENNLIDVTGRPNHTLTRLDSETAYTVKVRSIDRDNESCWSAALSFTTAESSCTKPTNLAEANISFTTADLSWNGTSDSYVLQYRPWYPAGDDIITTGAMQTYTVDLSQYEGTGSVAIRHYDISDMFQLIVDDIVVTNASGTEVYSQNFENCGGNMPAEFTNMDLDGDGFTWQIASSTNSNVNGTYGIVSESYNNDYGVLYPDNWLILSGIQMGGQMTFQARGQDPAYGAENFAIYVSTESSIVEVPVTGTSYNATGLTPNTPYAWQVKGVCSDEESSFASSFFKTKDDKLVFTTDGDWDNVANWKDAEGNAATALPTADNNVSIEAAAEIPAGVVAQANKVTIDGGSITIKDGGQLKQSAATLRVTVEKEIAGYGQSDGNYYFIASPFNGRTKFGNDGSTWSLVDNILEGEYDLYAFDPTNTGTVDGETVALEWVNYKNNPSHISFLSEPTSSGSGNPGMLYGEGYLYASQEGTTLEFIGTTGKSNNYSEVRDYTYNSEATEVWNGWKLVGNMFTCNGYINYVDASGNVLDADFYTLNNDNTYTLSESSVALAPCTGAFISCTASGKVQYSTEAPAKRTGMLNMNVSRNNKTVSQARLRFGQGHNLGSISFRNGSRLYMPVNGNDYAVVYTENQGEMPVSFRAAENGNYTLSFNTENVELGYLHLIDNMTGNDVDLLSTPSYSFEAKTTDYASRFKLVFATGNADDSFAFFSNGSFVINNEGNATLQVMDVTGRMISSENINGCANVNVNAAPGVYMIRLVNGDNVKVQKVVVR